MKAWLTIPSARPDGGTAKVWKAAGYGVALFRDIGAPPVECADVTITGRYEGYAMAVNRLSEFVFQYDRECEFAIAAGDDTTPDPDHSPDTIASECMAHANGTMLVMQPTGHRWGDDAWGRQRWPDAPAYIDRICGSPFLGREWCRRGNQGHGPFHPGFYHMHGDECLQEVAKKLGILWQRPDLTHIHNHWGLDGDATKMPEFLRFANSPEHWQESKALLNRLRAGGFAECMPIL